MREPLHSSMRMSFVTVVVAAVLPGSICTHAADVVPASQLHDGDSVTISTSAGDSHAGTFAGVVRGTDGTILAVKLRIGGKIKLLLVSKISRISRATPSPSSARTTRRRSLPMPAKGKPSIDERIASKRSYGLKRKQFLRPPPIPLSERESGRFFKVVNSAGRGFEFCASSIVTTSGREMVLPVHRQYLAPEEEGYLQYNGRLIAARRVTFLVGNRYGLRKHSIELAPGEGYASITIGNGHLAKPPPPPRRPSIALRKPPANEKQNPDKSSPKSSSTPEAPKQQPSSKPERPSSDGSRSSSVRRPTPYSSASRTPSRSRQVDPIVAAGKFVAALASHGWLERIDRQEHRVKYYLVQKGRNWLIKSLVKDFFYEELGDRGVSALARVIALYLDKELTFENFVGDTLRDEIKSELHKQDPVLGASAEVVDFLYEMHRLRNGS